MLIKIKTLLRLGSVNLLRVLVYRLALKFKLSKRHFKPCAPVQGAFFAPSDTPLVPFSGAWRDHILAFGWQPVSLEQLPDWHCSMLGGQRHPGGLKHWSVIPDFGEAGDVKGYWELSRFDWVAQLTFNYLDGDIYAIETLNHWLNDWSTNNPCNLGVNWKCGQEASLRVIHLLFAANLLKQLDKPQAALVQMIEQHLRRISPTISYAVAQDNNHGTSEAVALFIGGAFLAQQGISGAKSWMNKGRAWLENRVERLVLTDGSFSQYSVNYHRLMLDSISFCELCRQSFNQAPFTEHFYRKMAAATLWLKAMSAPKGGDCANIGANDGARLFPLPCCDYRDFRPSIQWAAALFLNARAYAETGRYDGLCTLSGIDLTLPPLEDAPVNQVYPDGGYAVMSQAKAKVMMRFAQFRFRPGQCDLLHLDFWLGDKNWLMDAGSFSYNAKDDALSYFHGVKAHNTIEFDERDQMPKLSRFLYGAWPSSAFDTQITEDVNGLHFCAGYRDYLGADHIRKVTLTDGKLVVCDRVHGFKQKAVLRWRLAPGQYQLSDNRLTTEGFSLTITADCPITRMTLLEGEYSTFYSIKQPLPVLEVEIGQNASITTTVNWN